VDKNTSRIFAAEVIGTFILMIGGPGTAVLAAGTGAFGDVGALAVALGFGFSLLVAAYAIGPISGCHINPAVTIGMAAAKKIEMALVPVYFVAQLLGAALGGAAIFAIASGMEGGFSPTAEGGNNNFAANLWGFDFGFMNFTSMVIVEILLTALLVFVVLSTTSKKFSASQGGLTVGIALVLIHLASIPVDNTSVNPARSFGMAIFAQGEAINQLWAFFVFPIIGAVVGVAAWLAVSSGDEDEAEAQAA
jgi:aquaporin Z